MQASLVVSAWRLFISFLSSVALLKLPRRPLFLSTTLLVCLSMASLGVFSYFQVTPRGINDKETLIQFYFQVTPPVRWVCCWSPLGPSGPGAYDLRRSSNGIQSNHKGVKLFHYQNKKQFSHYTTYVSRKETSLKNCIEWEQFHALRIYLYLYAYVSCRLSSARFSRPSFAAPGPRSSCSPLCCVWPRCPNSSHSF